MNNKPNWQELGNKHLEEYLITTGVIKNKNEKIRCISGTHTDSTPSMQLHYDSNINETYLHCFACGKNYKLSDFIKEAYDITSEKEAYKKALDIFRI